MPVIRYHCSKCGHEFELTRPQSKASELVPCSKCGHSTSPHSSLPGTAQPWRSETVAPAGRRRELPPWARGQVEAQVGQLVAGGDVVGGHEVELITQEVLRELSNSSLEVTPANINMLAQKHLAGLDSWARTARRKEAQLDEAARLDDEE